MQLMYHNCFQDTGGAYKNQWKSPDARDTQEPRVDLKTQRWPRGAQVTPFVPGVTRRDVFFVTHEMRIWVDTYYLQHFAELAKSNLKNLVMPADFLEKVAASVPAPLMKKLAGDKEIFDRIPFYDNSLAQGLRTKNALGIKDQNTYKMFHSCFLNTLNHCWSMLRTGTHRQWESLQAALTFCSTRITGKSIVYPQCTKYVENYCPELLPLLKSIPDPQFDRQNHYKINGEVDTTTGMSSSNTTTLVNLIHGYVHINFHDIFCLTSSIRVCTCFD